MKICKKVIAVLLVLIISVASTGVFNFTALAATGGVTDTYAFGTHGSYTTIGSVDIAKENYRCHFYK